MNSIVTLTIIYGLMTMGSAGILYASFRERIDISAKYFLLAELATLPTLVLVSMSNLDTSYQKPIVFFSTNLFGLLSEICVVFSIYTLSRDNQKTKLILAVTCAVIYCALIEIYRQAPVPNLPVALMSLTSFTLALGTYTACKSSQGDELKSNQFLSWIQKVEIGLGLFALLRIISCFTAEPIGPRNPSPFVTISYAIFGALTIFRYISYQSLRISWADPETKSSNLLNKNLAQAIEEKNNLLHALIASNRVIGVSALASSVVHQICQPLTTISFQVEIIKRELKKSNQNVNSLAMLDKLTLQLGKLSDIVKNMRRLFNGRSYAFKKIELQTVTNEILEIIEPTLESKKINLTKKFISNPAVLGDRIQLQQVLINLLNNAIDAIVNSNSASREIKLTIVSDEKLATISLEDTGLGIDTSMLSGTFDLYKTTKKDGLGVGLWLSKTIIDHHHGSILASNSSDGGAIFTVQIPLADQEVK